MPTAECKDFQVERGVFAIQVLESAAVIGGDEIYSRGVPGV